MLGLCPLSAGVLKYITTTGFGFDGPLSFGDILGISNSK
jgi:hypothetical protein